MSRWATFFQVVLRTRYLSPVSPIIQQREIQTHEIPGDVTPAQIMYPGQDMRRCSHTSRILTISIKGSSTTKQKRFEYHLRGNGPRSCWALRRLRRRRRPTKTGYDSERFPSRPLPSGCCAARPRSRRPFSPRATAAHVLQYPPPARSRDTIQDAHLVDVLSSRAAGPRRLQLDVFRANVYRDIVHLGHHGDRSCARVDPTLRLRCGNPLSSKT